MVDVVNVQPRVTHTESWFPLFKSPGFLLLVSLSSPMAKTKAKKKGKEDDIVE